MTFFTVSLPRPALRRFVDDYELGDVNVSLFTPQLRCAFIDFQILSLTLKHICIEHFSVKCFEDGIGTIPDKIKFFCFGSLVL